MHGTFRALPCWSQTIRGLLTRLSPFDRLPRHSPHRLFLPKSTPHEGQMSPGRNLHDGHTSPPTHLDTPSKDSSYTAHTIQENPHTLPRGTIPIRDNLYILPARSDLLPTIWEDHYSTTIRSWAQILNNQGALDGGGRSSLPQPFLVPVRTLAPGNRIRHSQKWHPTMPLHHGLEHRDPPLGGYAPTRGTPHNLVM